MKKVKNLFDDFLKQKSENQLVIIDKLCEELNINPKKWFESFINDAEDHCGTDFLGEFFSNFMFYLSNEIQKELLKYIKPDGYNMYKQPYIHNNIDLSCCVHIIDGDLKFISKKRDCKEFKKVLNKLTLVQKYELMENKIFSFFATELKFFSMKDMRFLKLKQLENKV